MGAPEAAVGLQGPDQVQDNTKQVRDNTKQVRDNTKTATPDQNTGLKNRQNL